MTKLNKRQIAKFAAKTIVQSAAGTAITKAVLAIVPQSSDYHIAEIIGAVGGYVIGEELQPQTDAIVDIVADRIEQKHQKPNVVHNVTTM